MKIYIDTMMGNHWTVRGVDKASKIQLVKNIIRSKCGVSTDKQILTFKNVIMRNNTTLEEYGVVSGITIRLTLAATTGL